MDGCLGIKFELVDRFCLTLPQAVCLVGPKHITVFLILFFRAGDVGREEQKMRSDLARFKQQVQSQRDASALQLRRLQQAVPADSTSEAASALSASTASSKPLSLL